MTAARARGDFGFKPLLDTCELNGEAMMPTRNWFGLSLQHLYLYGGYRDADGVLYAVERKFIGPMSAGLWLMQSRDGDLRIDPSSLSTARGETKREMSPEALVFQDQLMRRAGPGRDASGEATLDLRITPRDLTWAEGDLFSLEGGLIPPGIQFYVPSENEPFFYVSYIFRQKGTILGKPVTGYTLFDQGYWPAGRDWKDFRYFNDLQVAWEVFVNEFDDGTVEWGHLSLGRQNFNWAAVLGDHNPHVLSTDVTASVDLGENDWAQRVVYDVGGQEWEWTPDQGGQLTEFSAARWGGYRAQAGSTRRRGETGTVRNWFTWLETFGDRIREDGVPATTATVAAGR